MNNMDLASDAPATPVDLNPEILRVIEARHHDPFSVLGRHRDDNGEFIRVFRADTDSISLGRDGPDMQRLGATDIFECRIATQSLPEHYRLYWKDSAGKVHEGYDPYSFSPQLSDFDIHLFGEGKHWHIYRFLGAHSRVIDGIEGVLFATWAPNAERVSVLSDFNNWDGRYHPMQVRGNSGIWELFIPGLKAGTLYKFEIRTNHQGHILIKSDPYGQHFEQRPKTAAIVVCGGAYTWQDLDWMEARTKRDWLHEPMSLYEVHLGSWRRNEYSGFLSYQELAQQIVEHVKAVGFTHVELLPVTEHPLDASWGYQTTGYFAPTSRFGDPDGFRYFVDLCHQNGIGVLMDWVPAHFPKDSHGLARYDGSALYEHEDPRLSEHPDWGTSIYNYGRKEVKNFLLANVIYWLEEFHIDGLRVDAVASMIYLDYSREQGEWFPNRFGGNENLEAIEFLRELNEVTHERFPGTLMIAEESTAWPQVTRPVWTGGLGFSMKWNMGWMHDTLAYMRKDPIHRHYHHDHLTFGLLYAFTENFVLPFSHDEVVHGKSSLLYKMPGDEWQRFANLRLLYTCMFTYPGKKLLFMGNEFAQGEEWSHDKELDWYVLDYSLHSGVQRMVRDLNFLYCDSPELHRHDFEPEGFEWIDCHDAAQSVLSYLRLGDSNHFLIVLNFTPVPRHGYRIGVPSECDYLEVINSDSSFYGGSNTGNLGCIRAEAVPWMGRPYSLSLTLPPLGGLVLSPQSG